MNLLNYNKTQVVALVSDGMMREENLTHWEICNELSKGKTIETVAEDYRLSSRHVADIKAKKCKKCEG